MYKKSLNQEKFNERQFVLDKYQLFYYKKDKASKSVTNFLILFFRGPKFQLDHVEQRFDHISSARNL